MAAQHASETFTDNRVLWSPSEVASMFGISLSTLRREMHRGRIRSVRLGRQHRFRREDIDAYIDACMEADP